MSGSKSLQVSWTHLSILADLNYEVVRMISVLLLISCQALSQFFVGTVPVTFMYHNFFSSLSRSVYFFFPKLEQQHSLDNKFFCFCLLILGLVFWPWFNEPIVSQSPREFYATNFLWQFLPSKYTVCQHGKVLISCMIPNESLYSVISNLYF